MDEAVERHYSGSGAIVDAISEALRAAGRDVDGVSTADLAAVDEFHIRGREATVEIAEALGIGPGSVVLDIGCGLGGPARALAELRSCSVVGVDLTPAFCEAAEELSRWTALDVLTSFRVGDATDLWFDDASFDAAVTIHAAMNIPDQPAMYREAHRVLRPGGNFVVYDVLQGEGGDVLFPVPLGSGTIDQPPGDRARDAGHVDRGRFRVGRRARLLRPELGVVPRDGSQHRVGEQTAGHLRSVSRRRLRRDGAEPGRQSGRSPDPYRHLHLSSLTGRVCGLDVLSLAPARRAPHDRREGGSAFERVAVDVYFVV